MLRQCNYCLCNSTFKNCAFKIALTYLSLKAFTYEENNCVIWNVHNGVVCNMEKVNVYDCIVNLFHNNH